MCTMYGFYYPLEKRKKEVGLRNKRMVITQHLLKKKNAKIVKKILNIFKKNLVDKENCKKKGGKFKRNIFKETFKLKKIKKTNTKKGNK